MNNDMLLITLVSAGVSLFLFYLITQGAVSSALRKENEAILKELRINQKLLVKDLFLKGYTREELLEAIELDGYAFWSTLRTGPEREARQEELKKIAAYQKQH